MVRTSFEMGGSRIAMVKVYGASDDLCEIENSKYKEDEIGCFDKSVKIVFTDGTRILVSYPKTPELAVWKIEVLDKGTAYSRLTECFDEDAKIYSDVFEIDAEIVRHTLVRRKP